MTTDPFTEAARAEAEAVMSEARERVGITVQEQTRYVEGHVAGAEWARTHLATQEESVLMTSREETISDRLSDAGYTEYAEDEDGGVMWVSAPLGEVLRIVSAAQEPTDAEAIAYLAAFVEDLPPGAGDDWTPDTIARVKRGLRAARRDEEKR